MSTYETTLHGHVVSIILDVNKREVGTIANTYIADRFCFGITYSHLASEGDIINDMLFQLSNTFEAFKSIMAPPSDSTPAEKDITQFYWLFTLMRSANNFSRLHAIRLYMQLTGATLLQAKAVITTHWDDPDYPIGVH